MPDDPTPPADTNDDTTSKADATQPTLDEPHGTGEDTDWKAQARKWEKRAKDNADAAARLAEFEDAQKSELEKAQETAASAEQRAAAAEKLLMRAQVAAAKGLTPAQAKRLTGDTQQELEADADELLELLAPKTPDPPGGRPKALRNGNRPEGDPTGFDPEALADQIYERGHI